MEASKHYDLGFSINKSSEILKTISAYIQKVLILFVRLNAAR